MVNLFNLEDKHRALQRSAFVSDPTARNSIILKQQVLLVKKLGKVRLFAEVRNTSSTKQVTWISESILNRTSYR